MTNGYFYVCDRCGFLYQNVLQVPEGDEWTCSACGSHAAWEYEPGKRGAAVIQSALISNLNASRLFRERVS